MKKLSEKQFWQNEWENENRNITENFIFDKIVRKYIPRGDSNKIYIEIGCAPGSFMTFFNKMMGYKVSGVDFSGVEITRNNLDTNNVKDYVLYDEDFLSFNSKSKYDVVASFGFIEHFDDFDAIVKRHKDLLKPNGYLIIGLPNLKYFNKLLYKLFNPSLLAIHNLKCMDLNVLKSLASECEIVYCNYYLSSFFQFNESNSELNSRPLIKSVFSFVKKAMSILRLDNIPNRLFSPYIILICQSKMFSK